MFQIKNCYRVVFSHDEVIWINDQVWHRFSFEDELAVLVDEVDEDSARNVHWVDGLVAEKTLNLIFKTATDYQVLNAFKYEIR